MLFRLESLKLKMVAKKAKSNRPKEIEVFVFPIKGMVFYPHTTVPLNIFEPRYIKMIEDSIESTTPIALTMGRTKQEKMIAGIGLPIVLEKYPDGSMVILLRGLGKVELQECVHTKPYQTFKAKLFEDVQDISEEKRFRLNRLKIMLTDWLQRAIEDEAQRKALIANLETPAIIVECFSAFMISEPTKRQEILEAATIDDQIDLIYDALPSTAHSLEA